MQLIFDNRRITVPDHDAPILSIELREGCKIKIVFSDGVEGVADLSRMFKFPVMRKLEDPEFFKSVRLVNGRYLEWNDNIDMCWHTLYELITGTEWPYDPEPSKDIILVKAEFLKPPDAFIEFSDGTSGQVRLTRFQSKCVDDRYHSPPDKITITPWGSLFWSGRSYDIEGIYFELAGITIDEAFQKLNS